MTLKWFGLSAVGLGLVAMSASCGDSSSSSGGSAGAHSGGASNAGGSSGSSAGSHHGGSSGSAGNGASGSSNGGNATGGNTTGGAAGASEAGAANRGGEAGASEAGAAGDANGGNAGSGASAGNAGTSGSGGSGGTPSCNDSNASTIDSYNPTFGCAHLSDSDPSDGESWLVYDAGFSVDPKTHYVWYESQSTAGSLAVVTAFCGTLTVAGISGFHVPTIDELRTLAFGCPATAPGGTCPIHDPDCLSKQCGGLGTGSLCASCLGSGTSDYMNPDSTLKNQLFHTSSLCSDCGATPEEWDYGPGNGNFVPQNVGFSRTALCVRTSAPAGL